MTTRILSALGMILLTLGMSFAAQEQKLSPVDQHLQILSEKLGLTSEQQSQIRPILSEMLMSFSRIQKDTTLSSDEREQKVKQVQEKAHREAAPLLTEDQRRKLEQVEQEHHDHQPTNDAH